MASIKVARIAEITQQIESLEAERTQLQREFAYETILDTKAAQLSDGGSFNDVRMSLEEFADSLAKLWEVNTDA